MHLQRGEGQSDRELRQRARGLEAGLKAASVALQKRLEDRRVLARLPMLGTDGAVNVVLKLGLIHQPIEALLLTQ
jgi:hypothetical protein